MTQNMLDRMSQDTNKFFNNLCVLYRFFGDWCIGVYWIEVYYDKLDGIGQETVIVVALDR